MELTKKCPWCGGELFRVHGAMNYPWDYSCSKCNGYCFERDVLSAESKTEQWSEIDYSEYAEQDDADRKRRANAAWQ